MDKKRAITILILAIFGTWLLTLWGGYIFFDSWTERGQFGDLFGSLNTLFSGLAFACLIYTIHLQRKELSIQREELKLQRKEMAASRAELAAQVSAQKALFMANIGQIRIASAQARIEAIKMDSEKWTPIGKEKHIAEIDEISKYIGELADKIENKVGG